MKTFLEHLTELQKTYSFKIKLANIDPAESIDRLESALESYGVANLSKATKLPIASNVPDFPNLGPTEVYILTADLTYPVTDEQLRQLIATRMRAPLAQIVVVPTNHPEELWRNNEGELREYKQGEAVLDKEYDNTGDAERKTAGKDYADAKILKRETKDVKWEISGDKAPKAKTTNDLVTNNKSPIGSK